MVTLRQILRDPQLLTLRHNIDDVMFRQRAVMGAREGRYGCTRGPIMCFEARAISARVTKQTVTIFSKTCDKAKYLPTELLLINGVMSMTQVKC